MCVPKTNGNVVIGSAHSIGANQTLEILRSKISGRRQHSKRVADIGKWNPIRAFHTTIPEIESKHVMEKDKISAG